MPLVIQGLMSQGGSERSRTPQPALELRDVRVGGTRQAAPGLLQVGVDPSTETQSCRASYTFDERLCRCNAGFNRRADIRQRPAKAHAQQLSIALVDCAIPVNIRKGLISTRSPQRIAQSADVGNRRDAIAVEVSGEHIEGVCQVPI